jgi:glucose-6-phosphate 1-dehydrogenase
MAITSELVREIFKGLENAQTSALLRHERLSLFTQRDAVEAAWSAFTALLHQWAAETTRDFPNYASGSSEPGGSVQSPR